MSFGNTAGNVGQQGTNSGNVAVGHQWNAGHYGRRGGFCFLYMQMYEKLIINLGLTYRIYKLISFSRFSIQDEKVSPRVYSFQS